MHLKYAPRLRFVPDESFAYAARIGQLLHDARLAGPARGRTTPMGRRKATGRPINGWLVIDKAPGMTSTQVVTVVKRLTQAQKVGHGGTLDPLATGVLPIAMGEATKTVAYVMDERKAYEFTLRFGEARDTDDAAGVVTATSELRPDRRGDPRGAAPVRRPDPAGPAALRGGQGAGRARLRHRAARRDGRARRRARSGSTSWSSSAVRTLTTRNSA